MNKIFLSQSDVPRLAAAVAKKVIDDAFPRGIVALYGIPRGGIAAAYAVLAEVLILKRDRPLECFIVSRPQDATVFIDDILDSGATRERFAREFPGVNFFTLVKKESPDQWFVFPWEICLGGQDSSAEDIPLRMLQYIGENPQRDGLKDTPARVVKSWDFLFSGYKIDPAEVTARVFTNEEKYDEMVVLRDIEFYSMCEHHILPFFGRVHIAYVPTDKVIGISKLARLVECFSRRLQIQERMTQQIANALESTLHPLGVAVMVEAKHLCMVARGVQKQNSVMVTSAIRGIIKENEAARMEFLSLKQGS